MSSQKNHVVPAILTKGKEGKTIEVGRFQVPQHSPLKGETRFLENVASIGVPVPAEWAEAGNGRTGYIDSIQPETFPEGKSVVYGQDKAGRTFISIRMKVFLYEYEEEDLEVITIFRRYAGDEGPWVIGGWVSLAEAERKLPFGEGVYESPFGGGVQEFGFELLNKLMEQGVVETQRRRWEKNTPTLEKHLRVSL